MKLLFLFCFKQFWKYKRHSAGILVCALLSLAFSSLFSLSFKYLVDEITMKQGLSTLGDWFSILTVGFLIYAACQLLGSYWLSRISESMKNDLRLEMFTHLQKLPISYYHKVSKSSLSSRFTSDLSLVHSAFIAIVPLVQAFLSIIVTLGLTVEMHWGLAALALLGTVCSSVVPVIINRRAIGLNDRVKSEMVAVNNYVQEHFVTHKTISAYNLKEWEFGRLSRTAASIFPLAVRAHFTTRTSPLSVSLGLLFFNIISVLVGLHLAKNHMITVGMLVAFQTLFLTMSQQVKELSRQFPALTSAVPSHERIARLLSELPEESEEARIPHAIQINKIDKNITLRGVSFGYPSGAPILREVNIKIPSNHYVAIIGRNGSGKSTMVSLLMRFYEPTKGKLEFDGKDARFIPIESLRNMFGYVAQDTELMNLSIYDNIRLGHLEAREQEVYGAAEEAGIHEWITQLPSGYLTNCGEGGQALSGGQRQHIAIARALVRDPSILIFDEVTSALDPESERLIQETIRGLAGDKTVITVTHRLNSVKDADTIILMDGGRVAHTGTHEQLLAECELYRVLWNKQSGFYISGDGRNAQIDARRLQRIPLFKGLEEDFLQYVCNGLGTEFVKAGETVVEQGGEGDKFYVIVRGTVEVLKRMENENEERVAVLEDGDHFGEISLMMSLPRNATIRTLTPCTFLTIRRSLFQTILDKSAPELRLRLEQSCRERMTS